MAEIKQFEFQRPKLVEIRSYHRGRNWPVVYILSDHGQPRRAYVGETIEVYRRTGQHISDPEKQGLEQIHIVTDYDFNQSATKDLESQLIQHLAGHDNYQLLNGNQGLVDLDYYDRDRYREKFEAIWNQLKDLKVVDQELDSVRNGNLFKYSPYKSLTEEQQEIADIIVSDFKKKPLTPQIHLVEGQPGTGKTVLASYLMKRLVDETEGKDHRLKIGLVVPNRRLQMTLKDVIGGLPGFSKKMVMSPHNIVGDHYDILIVDEAHLLGRAVSQARIGLFRQKNVELGLDPNSGTQLDWVRLSSTHQILLYDGGQAIRPANIRPEQIESLPVSRHQLNRQCRVLGGQSYISYIRQILDGQKPEVRSFDNYDFRFCEQIEELIDLVQSRENQWGLSRILAGWAWPWKIDDPSNIDQIKIGQTNLAYKAYSDTKSSLSGDIRLKDVTREVSSIHTIQGYDLNYAGVIIGPDLAYNPTTKQMAAVRSSYYDRMGKTSLANESELETYIKRIYLVLLTRAIRGTFVYVCDPHLRAHLRQFFTQDSR